MLITLTRSVGIVKVNKKMRKYEARKGKKKKRWSGGSMMLAKNYIRNDLVIMKFPIVLNNDFAHSLSVSRYVKKGDPDAIKNLSSSVTKFQISSVQ